jgi:hypothetical protein
MELLSRTCNLEQMNVQRIMARLFVIVGALFWGFSAWGAKWAYQGAPFSEALSFALMYAGSIMVLFVIGLFFENLAAVLSALVSVAIIGAGIVGGWEAGVWAVMIFFFTLPLMIAAALYAMAARMQRICSG